MLVQIFISLCWYFGLVRHVPYFHFLFSSSLSTLCTDNCLFILLFIKNSFCSEEWEESLYKCDHDSLEYVFLDDLQVILA